MGRSIVQFIINCSDVKLICDQRSSATPALGRPRPLTTNVLVGNDYLLGGTCRVELQSKPWDAVVWVNVAQDVGLVHPRPQKRRL